jgi:8-oxo-dGTP pyrophosphatase MutT (NUDIX family)
MRANEFVTELFEPGKPWQWSFQGSEEAVAVFHVGEVPYMFHAYGSDGEWEAEFKRHGSKLDRSQKFGLTGTGNSAEVMSTVVDIMRAFLEKYRDKIQVLSFSAKEDSRQGLYARMVKRLLPDWTMKQSGEHFVLVAPKQAVAESLQPTAAGCIIVAEDTGRWCLQQRSDSVSDPGVWSTWGGGREPGETLEQAVRRELAEEGGYTGPLKLKHLHTSPQYATYIAFVPQEFEPEINFESKDWCWADQDQLPEPMHPGLVEALGMLSEARAQSPDRKVIQLILSAVPYAQEIWFHGSRATGKHRPNSDTDILVVVPSDVVGEDYLETVMTLQKVAQQLPNYDIQPTKISSNIYRIAHQEGQLLWSVLDENFADGKVKGKSRPGRVKRAGASCNGSVTDLRARAKRASGERARMYHWCANMKSGRKK